MLRHGRVTNLGRILRLGRQEGSFRCEIFGCRGLASGKLDWRRLDETSDVECCPGQLQWHAIGTCLVGDKHAPPTAQATCIPAKLPA